MMLLTSCTLAFTQPVHAHVDPSVEVWTAVQEVLGLAARGDTVVAATDGGLVRWIGPTAEGEVATSADGLPGTRVEEAREHPDTMEWCVRTQGALACGQFPGPWRTIRREGPSPRARTFSILAAPGGVWVAGGTSGWIFGWNGDRADSVRVPDVTGNVIALTWAGEWARSASPDPRGRVPDQRSKSTDVFPSQPQRTDDGHGRLARGKRSCSTDLFQQPEQKGKDTPAGTHVFHRPRQPLDPPGGTGVFHESSGRAGSWEETDVFQPGLVAAVDPGGVWVLVAARPRREWRHLGVDEGLPSDRVHDVLRDVEGSIWVATSRGLARWSVDGRVDTWPADPVMREPAMTLFPYLPDDVGLALDTGIARVHPEADPPLAEHTPWAPGPVRSVAWNTQGLWWTDGRDIRSFIGASRSVAPTLAEGYGTTLLAVGPYLYVGHPGGGLSRFDGTGWARYGAIAGLPGDRIYSLVQFEGRLQVGTFGGLYEQVNEGPGTEPAFGPIDEGPPGVVRAQAVWRGAHWVGTTEGLWERFEFGWRLQRLWPGATEVQDIAAAAGTLWVTAGPGGVAGFDGRQWLRPRVGRAAPWKWFGALHVGDDGNPWIGTERGVARIDGIVLKEVAGSPRVPITALGYWNGHLVAGTSDGLWLREPDGGWTHLGIEEGLPDATVVDLETGPWGGLWVATPHGVARMSHRTRWDPPRPRRAARPARDVAGSRAWVRAGPRGLRVSLAPEIGGSVQRLDVFDVRGRRVVSGRPDAAGLLPWNAGTRAASVARGIYFVRIRTPRATLRARVFVRGTP